MFITVQVYHCTSKFLTASVNVFANGLTGAVFSIRTIIVFSTRWCRKHEGGEFDTLYIRWALLVYKSTCIAQAS